jgi:hypothetical protein
MKALGPKSERETVVVLCDGEAEARIWTASSSMYRKLRKRGFMPIAEDERSASFKIPKRSVSFRQPRAKKEQSA